MGVAYYIVLDNPNPGFDAFVNGKTIARESKRISRLATNLGLKSPDDYCSMSPGDAASFAEDFGLDSAQPFPPEQWFTAEEGIQWVSKLRSHIQSRPQCVKEPDALVSDLSEFEVVLTKALSVGAMWHLFVDF